MGFVQSVGPEEPVARTELIHLSSHHCSSSVSECHANPRRKGKALHAKETPLRFVMCMTTSIKTPLGYSEISGYTNLEANKPASFLIKTHALMEENFQLMLTCLAALVPYGSSGVSTNSA